MRRLAPAPEEYPAFSPALAASMRRETLAFVDHLAFETDGTFGDAFDADYTFVDRELAELYGIEGDFGDGLVRAPTDPSERAGVLTQASVLAVRSGAEPLTRFGAPDLGGGLPELRGG